MCDEIAVTGMDFHSIESCLHGSCRCLGESAHDAFDFALCQLLRLFAPGQHAALHDRRGSDGLMSAVTFASAEAPSVLQLDEGFGFVPVDRLAYSGKAGNESIIVDAELIGNELTHEIDTSDSENNGADSACGARFVEGRFSLGDVSVVRGEVQSHAGQYEAVLERQAPELSGAEESLEVHTSLSLKTDAPSAC